MHLKADYLNDRDAAWGFGNTVLYRMCINDAPNHDDCDQIASKCRIIGRTYSVSPQRGSGKPRSGQTWDFFAHLAKSKDWAGLDRHLGELTQSNCFSRTSLEQILAVHGYLVRLVERSSATRNLGDREARHHVSFASKYLHFHRPDHFPIFDSVVSAELRARFRKERFERGADPFPGYGRFCRLMLLHVENLGGASWTLRSIDRDLYEAALAKRFHDSGGEIYVTAK